MAGNPSGSNLGRRSFLSGAASLAAGSAVSRRPAGGEQPSSGFHFHLAMCNEAFASAGEKKSFKETCEAIRKAGYTGIEVAPFTLAEDPIAIPAGQRRDLSSTMRSEGLTFAGLHWLLLAPKGLNVTTPDRAVRERSWRHMWNLIDSCADLGPGGVMTLGSPDQRSVGPGESREEAGKYFTEGLAGIAPHAVERGVKVAIETFTQRPNAVARTLEEAVAMVRKIASPGIQTMFDCNNASQEKEPHAALVDRYFEFIKHVHLTETGGPYPGTGSYDYKPVLKVLRRRGYSGWLSLEVFDFSAGAGRIAQDSFQYMQAEIARLG